MRRTIQSVGRKMLRRGMKPGSEFRGPLCGGITKERERTRGSEKVALVG